MSTDCQILTAVQNILKLKTFLKEGKLSKQLNVSIEGRLTDNYIIICTTENANKSGGKCATTQADGLEKPAYLVEWNRFGNISKFKWSGSAWNRL